MSDTTILSILFLVFMCSHCYGLGVKHASKANQMYSLDPDNKEALAWYGYRIIIAFLSWWGSIASAALFGLYKFLNS